MPNYAPHGVPFSANRRRGVYATNAATGLGMRAFAARIQFRAASSRCMMSAKLSRMRSVRPQIT